ncbi:Ubiquinone/menaquinone biosynthesis C-methyltransferase UbiE [Candidatus Anstonella stagnisolia]|nr:Ubiquinone/menaquinone biosynthesis C-methyltransferase UbiE [Candidatus Anstonella stagnisolia]
MEILLLTKGYWPLPPMKSIYISGEWRKLNRARNTTDNEKSKSFSINSHSFSGLIIVEAKLGKALSKKIYLVTGNRKILLSRWIGGLYSNCSTKNVSQVREFYNAIASRYSYHTEPERKAQLATIASSLPKNSLVLDASAGTCLFSEVAKKYSLHTVCMDLSAKMLSQRKDKRSYAIVSSAAKAPFPPSSFDAVVHLFSNLLPYDKTLFKKFRTLLRPHGILLYHPVKSPGEQWLPDWREKTLVRLKSAGFSKVSLRSLPSLGKKKSILTFFWAQK